MRYLLLPLFLLALDIISIVTAALLSVYLRFEFEPTAQYVDLIVANLPVLVLIGCVCIYSYRLYNRIWKYAGASELLAVIGSCFTTVTLWYVYFDMRKIYINNSLFIISSIILLLLIGSSRLALRMYTLIASIPSLRKHFSNHDNLRNVLVIGAGDAGAVIAREIQRYHNDGRKVVGFIDDDPAKQHQEMFGVRVLGNRFMIKEVVMAHNIEEIIIALPSVKGEEVRKIVEICKRTDCKLQILPGIYEILNGKASISKLRDVQIEDLLGREPIELDNTAVKSYIADKIVLVTGGGGSIGSEICRQVAKMGPKKLLIMGKGENSIYGIHQEMLNTDPELRVVPIIADVRDRQRVEDIMSYFHPQVVFHAAAHKHVPLMEWQPIEAVKNNVWGTKVVAETADKFNVETFVMISTDKAVNPTSVMGCTKRVAEMFVQSMNAISKTRFVAVRFGNVLGSRGSVIPLFKKQIAKGGPVTVTHPDMKRYFMTIPEASQLVLQAGAMAKGGEVFVLDMGQPVKICDLAKDLIRLSGLTPDVDIKIKYTGLRPGEKLFEELLSAEDGTESTNHKKIFTARIKEVPKAQMDVYVEELLSHTNEDEVVAALQKVVPTYKPNRIKNR